MRSTIRLLATFVLLPVSVQGAFAQDVTAFTNATVIDGRGGSVQRGVTVVVRGTQIESVGPSSSLSVPRGATVIDATGKTLLPGLADSHVHLTGGWDGERVDFLGFPRYLNALLYAGITSVFDVGNSLSYVQQLKQEVSAGRLAGPRIRMAGALVDGADPVWPDISVSLVTASQAPAIVRKMKQSGGDAIKAYVGLSERLLTALTSAASAESLRVIADLGRNNGSEWGVRAGISAYAHASSSPISDATIALMKSRGVMNISTLAVLESFAGTRLKDLTFLDDSLLSRTMPPFFVAELRAYATRARTAADEARERAVAQGLASAKENIRRLHQAGIPIVAGTDSPYPGVYFGEGLHRELELLVQAGLTPVEAISAATRNAAALARDTTWGTIEPGKRADLLLVNGRPDEHIADTRRIVIVMQGGRQLQRERLAEVARSESGYRAVGTPLSTK